MVLCWSQQPKDRPSASQIVSIASAPEFTHLSDVVSLKHQAPVVASTSTALTHITGNCSLEKCLVVFKHKVEWDEVTVKVSNSAVSFYPAIVVYI